MSWAIPLRRVAAKTPQTHFPSSLTTSRSQSAKNLAPTGLPRLPNNASRAADAVESAFALHKEPDDTGTDQ